MAKSFKCPRCPAQIDASSLTPGSSVRCAGCGALVRIPTGNTSVRTPALSPPAAEPEKPAANRASRGTDVRRKAGPAPKKSKTGLFVGIGVAAVFVIVLVLLMVGGKKPEPPAEPAAARPKTPPAASKPSSPAAPPAAPAEKPPMEAPRPAASPKGTDWDQIMKNLRAGGGFDDLSRPEGATFARVKSMGKDAYPRLIGYIDNEDLALGKAAVTALNALTGQNKALPRTEADKAKIKAEWEAWLKGGSEPAAEKKP